MFDGEAQDDQRRRHPLRHDHARLRELRGRTQDLSRKVPRGSSHATSPPPWLVIPRLPKEVELNAGRGALSRGSRLVSGQLAKVDSLVLPLFLVAPTEYWETYWEESSRGQECWESGSRGRHADAGRPRSTRPG